MYTYDDIVTAKDILTGKVKKEDIIGKKGWLLDCIPQDMSLNVITRLGVHVCLTEIDLDSISPFGDGGIPFTYFLPDKEESAPEPVIEKKSYKERQAEWVESNNVKVGDKVRIVKEWNGFEKGNKPTVGETGRIECIDPPNVRVRFDSDNDWWWYDFDAVELIKDESAYIPFDLSDPKDRDFLRGKWVRSKNPDVFNEFEIAHFVRINNTNQDIMVETSNGVSYFAGELLYDYEFLDGSHVGRRKEEA